jgi:acyl carrier protein
MIFGFVMAKKYDLSKDKNASIQKYLAIERDGETENLSAEEKLELDSLKKSLV